ncbi:efflux RND transporter periplasmic adaptor subunit [Roseimaritima sediminicola]|uniref:efflux RND transporter periplasmic adaptor subunit n=1 Tax=Roseimaritima sediminicola TaxID=2662066 RepID=UPI0012982C58|nr:efflux RND transporter periplasmic adaptor subunit [Roseimaritima sediminicola]
MPRSSPTLTDAQPSSRKGFWLRVVVSVLACGSLLAASAYAVVVIQRTEPVAETETAKRKSAALVETVIVRRGTYRPSIEVLGTVQAAREVDLAPRVSGQVVAVSDSLVPGGMVRAGEELLRIDPADFENALRIRQSELEQAEASLRIESGRQSLAQKELKLLEGTINSTNRALVLREPQIASIRAEVNAALAAIERAQLDLQRTKVLAPFDAQVLSRDVNVGSQVSPGDSLARLVGVEEYWVSAAVPVRSLRWIQFADTARATSGSTDPATMTARLTLDGSALRRTAREASGTNVEGENAEVRSDNATGGATVKLRDPDAWGPDVVRRGTVSRMIGALDNQTRLARVLVTISDPLALHDDLPPLILGSLIDVEIQGRPVDAVVRLDRQYLRDGDTVWVNKDDKLEIRAVEVLYRDARYAYIQSGLEDGEEVVITTLATVADGVGLRRVEPAAEPAAEDGP